MKIEIVVTSRLSCEIVTNGFMYIATDLNEYVKIWSIPLQAQYSRICCKEYIIQLANYDERSIVEEQKKVEITEWRYERFKILRMNPQYVSARTTNKQSR